MTSHGKTYMISGPHAIGKSASARELADILNLANVGSIAGFIAEQMRYEFDKATDIEVAQYQREVARSFEFILEATKMCNTVFDRSPLDFAVYMTLQTGDSPSFSSVIKSYQDYCLDLTKKHCNVLILPQADLEDPYEKKVGRPSFSKEQVAYREAYVDLLDYFVEQLPKDEIKVITVPAEYQYNERIKYILGNL